jgi:hypothetical protein
VAKVLRARHTTENQIVPEAQAARLDPLAYLLIVLFNNFAGH